MLRGVCLKLRSIQTYMTERCHPSFYRQHYTLLEAFLEKFIVVFPEITQYSEIGAVKMGHEHKGKIFMAPLLYLTRTENPLAISIYQDAPLSAVDDTHFDRER